MRILLEPLARRGQPHQLEQLERAVVRGPA